MNCLLVGALKQNEGQMKIYTIKFSMCVCLHYLGKYYINKTLRGIVLNIGYGLKIYRLMIQGINIAMRILEFIFKETNNSNGSSVSLFIRKQLDLTSRQKVTLPPSTSLLFKNMIGRTVDLLYLDFSKASASVNHWPLQA